MGGLLFSLVLMNSILFATLGIWAARSARREASPRLRILALLVTMTATAFVLSSLQRLALQGSRAGWISPTSVDFLLEEWQIVQSLVAFAVAVIGLAMLARTWPSLSRTERMVANLVDRLPAPRPVEGLGLTPRELEVLRLIAQGNLSDQQIAAELHIAPSTAQTHVKRILRKSGLGSRRELMLAHYEDDREAARPWGTPAGLRLIQGARREPAGRAKPGPENAAQGRA